MSEPEMDQWATHLPALVACATATRGPILECGTGLWSTPILHALCAPTERALVSVESNPEWLSRFEHMRCSWHDVRHVASWDDVAGIGDDATWAFAFVDHGHAPRGPVVAALRERADIVVMHDSECGYCGYTEPLQLFDWCWTHKFSPAWTTIAGMGTPPSWLDALPLPGEFGVPVPYRG